MAVTLLTFNIAYEIISTIYSLNTFYFNVKGNKKKTSSIINKKIPNIVNLKDPHFTPDGNFRLFFKQATFFRLVTKLFSSQIHVTITYSEKTTTQQLSNLIS